MSEKISCENGPEFKVINDNNTFNHNDEKALYILALFVLSIIFICLYFIFDSKLYLCISIALLLITFIKVYTNPIMLLHIMSFIVGSSLRTPEFLDKDEYFPNNRVFEEPDNFKKIKKEVENLLKLTNDGDSLKMVKDTYDGANKYIGSHTTNNGKKAWRIFNIKIQDKYTEDSMKYFPFLVSLLKKIPEVGTCVVSILQPGIKIPIHVGHYKGMTRYMMPVIVPKDKDNVFLCVNEKKYHWEEGVGVVWDDTYPHKVYNNTKELRVVLYMDIKRPFTGIRKILNEWTINLSKDSKIINEEIKKSEIQVKINK